MRPDPVATAVMPEPANTSPAAPSARSISSKTRSELAEASFTDTCAFEQDAVAVYAGQLAIDHLRRPVQRVIVREEVDVIGVHPQPEGARGADEHQQHRHRGYGTGMADGKTCQALHGPEKVSLLGRL